MCSEGVCTDGTCVRCVAIEIQAWTAIADSGTVCLTYLAATDLCTCRLWHRLCEGKAAQAWVDKRVALQRLVQSAASKHY